MHWMADWPMPHLPLVAKGPWRADRPTSTATTLDDFCLGDTGSMFGHSPAPVAKAIRQQARRGLTYMLPTEAALAGRALLTDRFGPFRWQIATTATDANRFALRVARAVTGRPKMLVFNGCYHGTVDDTMVRAGERQAPSTPRPSRPGPRPDRTAVCASSTIWRGRGRAGQGDVAAILTEPVMTNSCMVLPEAGFHDGLRSLSRNTARC
jgi:glutamate-1-semialdehyde 2,1-aminomutase